MLNNIAEDREVIESPEILRLIENSKLFRGVPHEVLEPLFSKAKRITLDQGEQLLTPGKINENVYVLLSGRLSVQVSLSTSDKPIAMLAPGECVGEMSVLVDGLVSAYVIAVARCELYAIDYSSFWALIDGSNEAARNMLNILVYRIRIGNEVMADSLLHHDEFPDSDIIDKLTGLYNYHGMHRKFERLLQRCVTGKQPLCFMMLEVDDLEIDAGIVSGLQVDQSLRVIAQTILTFLRPNDASARLIGKKFAVLLADVTLPDAVTTAERLRTAISQTSIVLPDGNTLPPVTISAGVSEALSDDTYGTLIARAEMLLDESIVAGRNRVTTFQKD